jgi:hypothetical protein
MLVRQAGGVDYDIDARYQSRGSGRSAEIHGRIVRWIAGRRVPAPGCPQSATLMAQLPHNGRTEEPRSPRDENRGIGVVSHIRSQAA